MRLSALCMAGLLPVRKQRFLYGNSHRGMVVTQPQNRLTIADATIEEPLEGGLVAGTGDTVPPR